MKRILGLVLVLVLIASSAHATMVATRVSGNAVSFSTVTGVWATTPNVVTFNSVTNHIVIRNFSRVSTLFVDLRCVDSNGTRGYMTATSPQLAIASSSTVQIDFATKNLGFMSTADQVGDNSVVGSNQVVTYTVTGDVGEF